MPSVAEIDRTGDPYVDGVLNGVKWSAASLTFSFPAHGSYYETGYGLHEPRDAFEQLNATQMAAARASFTMYASVAALQFVEIIETSIDDADLRMAMSDKPSTAWAYYPTTSPEGGDAWFNNSSGAYDRPVKGNYAHVTLMHELGHSLGLEHAHTGNVMPVERDSLEYTVMSYRSYVGASTSSGYTNETWGFPQSLMMYDIAAIQHLYGPNYDSNSGNTTYAWSPATGEMFIDGVGQGAPGANRIFATVWDGGGVDTYDFSSYATNLNIDLRPGQWSTTSTEQLADLRYDGSQVAAGNIANALQFNDDPRSLIENAEAGSGDDLMVGNSGANGLWGHRGDDELYGAEGDDYLYGGKGWDFLAGEPGNDVLFGEAGNDRLAAGSGHDVVRGGSGNDLVFGSNGEDRVYGGHGNDVVIGGMDSDLLVGGPDADRFVFTDIRESPPSAQRDTIFDFSRAEGDLIDLSPIDADVTTSANDTFMFIGTDMFSGLAGELGYTVTSEGHAVVRGDVTGDAGDDFQIVVDFTTQLTADDFLV